MQNPQSSDSLTVQTIDGKGKAPKRRIASPQAGLLAWNQMREIERRRDLRFNAIAGIYAGFPPTPPEQMEEMGMADFPNINCKQFQSKVDSYVGNWNAINAAGSDWYECEAEHDEPMEAARRSKVLSKHFNCAIRQWEGTDYFAVGRHYIIKSATRDTQMGLFGIGVGHFCDHIDFRWKVRPTRKVLVPEGTNLLLDNCPFLAIEDEMSVPDLWAMRGKPGWNEETIKALLYLNTFRNNQQAGRAETLAEWTERIRENDTWQYSDFPLVKFIHLYVKEFESTPNKASITHCIISDAVPALSNATNQKEFEGAKDQAMSWLYEKENIATRWNQIVCVFSDNAGPEEKWHGVKGFGDLIFDGCHFNNLFFNRTAASAIVSNMLLFKGGNEGDRQKMNQIKVTPFGALIDLEIEQFQLRADTQAAVGMFQLGTSIIDTNSRQFPQGQQTVGGEAPTATQVNFDRADEARFTNLQVSFYRSTGLDCLGAEMYRRIAQPASKYPPSWPGGDIAKQFRDRCEAEGIPEADLLKVRYVRANRNTGSGNMGLDVMRGDQLLSIATPGQGQLNAQKFKATALVGPDMASAFVIEEAPAPNAEDVTINQENMCIQGGQTPQAFGQQPHEKHLMGGATQGHLPMLGEIEQLANQMLEAGLEQNVEAADKLLRSLQAGIEHSGQHVQFLSQYRRAGKGKALFEEQVKEFSKVLNDLSQFAESFGQALEQAQQAVNPQAGMDPEMVKAQAEIQRKQMITEADIEMKNQKTLASLEAAEVKNALKAEQALSSHETKLAQQAQQKQLDLEAQAAKSQQELLAQQASNTIEIGKKAVLGRMDVRQSAEKAQTETEQ